jgi:hypothetical protein
VVGGGGGYWCWNGLNDGPKGDAGGDRWRRGVDYVGQRRQRRRGGLGRHFRRRHRRRRNCNERNHPQPPSVAPLTDPPGAPSTEGVVAFMRRERGRWSGYHALRWILFENIRI